MLFMFIKSTVYIILHSNTYNGFFRLFVWSQAIHSEAFTYLPSDISVFLLLLLTFILTYILKRLICIYQFPFTSPICAEK